MPFTRIELDYLTSQRLGRLATVQPDGTLQVNPVGFSVDAATGTIDIRGYDMASSRKFRNVADNGRVAFVVDDVPSLEPMRVRCLEIRGYAQAIPNASDAPDNMIGGATIRIHPERIISFGVDEDRAPHLLTPNSRDVT